MKDGRTTGKDIRVGSDADKINQVLEDFQIGWAMIVILGFYFGAGAAEGFMDKKKGNK